MTTYTEVIFLSVSIEQQEILTAILDSYGFEGFEEGEDYLKAFIPKKDFEQINLAEALQDIPALQNISFTTEEIAPKNWNAEWEQNFQPITVASQLYIRASFHAERKDIPLEIVIDPKMSFGTGHHATTYMMSELMMQADFKNKTVFDFGSGTGILSILAAKLGASSVYALDHEEWAYHNCIENCELNGVKNVEAVYGDESKFPQQPFDIILANINKNIISKNIALLSSLLEPNGLLFISGFLQQDVNDLLLLASNNKLTLTEQKEKDGWVCMKLGK
jgi:ribosomal protein L11 methyltransferase